MARGAAPSRGRKVKARTARGSRWAAAPRAVGAFLRSVRLAQKLSQEQVARSTRGRLRLSRSAISAIERGRNLPSLEALIALSRALHVDPKELIERAELDTRAPFELQGICAEELERRADERFWAGEFRAAAAVYEALLERLMLDPPADAVERVRRGARLELRRAAALRRCGMLLTSRSAAERALTLAEGHTDLQVDAYFILTALHKQTGTLPLARDAAERALELSRSCGDKVQGRALLEKGSVLYAAGSYENARQSFVRARELLRRAGDHLHYSHIEGNIGNCLIRLGRPRQARAALVRAVELARKHGQPALEGSRLVDLGQLALTSGDLDSADRYAAEALRIVRSREHWLTTFRAEWLRHRVVRRREAADADRQRVAYLKKLLARLEDHRGDESIQEFKTRYMGLVTDDEGETS